MKMKLSALFAIAAIAGASLLSLNAAAQQSTHTPEARAKMWTDSMKTDLNLTDSQYSQIYKINLDFVNKMKDLRSQQTPDDQRKSAFRELNKSRMSDIGTLLTPDQQEKFKTLHKEKMSEMRSRRQNDK